MTRQTVTVTLELTAKDLREMFEGYLKPAAIKRLFTNPGFAKIASEEAKRLLLGTSIDYDEYSTVISAEDFEPGLLRSSQR